MTRRLPPLPPPPDAPRVFLDAGVLYAAAIGGGSARLWTIPAISLVTNEFAAAEAWDSLAHETNAESCRAALVDLLNRLELVPTPDVLSRAQSLRLKDPNDLPIVLGAVESGCHYLLTADKTCFGEHFGRQLAGVTVLQTGVFLQLLGLPRPPRPEA